MPFADPERRREYQRQWLQSRRRSWLEANGPCVDCQSWNRLEVDHVDPTMKVAHKVWSWTAARREAELAKCVVRCQNCHKQKTREQAQTKKHGTYGMRNRGCTCAECKEYVRRIKAEWRRKQRGEVLR